MQKSASGSGRRSGSAKASDTSAPQARARLALRRAGSLLVEVRAQALHVVLVGERSNDQQLVAEVVTGLGGVAQGAPQAPIALVLQLFQLGRLA